MAADPRRLEAPAAAADEEDADPLASLPADFAAFSLTQTHPRSGDAKAEPFEQQRQYKTRMCIYGDKCPYGPGRCFFAHDESELRPPQARWWLPEYKTKPCRYAASSAPFMRTAAASTRTRSAGRRPIARDSLDTTDAGRGAQYLRPPPAKTQDKKYKTRMCRYCAGTCPYGVSCSYAHSAVVFRAEKSTLRAVDAKSGSVRAREELRPREPDEPPGEPTDVVSRLERLRALRDSGSLSAVEFEVLKQQVLREPGSFAAQAPVLLAPTAPPPPRCLSPPPPDAYMLPAMAMPPRAVPRPPAYAPQPPYAAVPGPPRGYGVPQLLPRGYGAPPPPCGRSRGPRGRRILGTGRRGYARRAVAGPRRSTQPRPRPPRRAARAKPLCASSQLFRLRSGCYFPTFRSSPVVYNIWCLDYALAPRGRLCSGEFAAAARPSAARAPTSPERRERYMSPPRVVTTVSRERALLIS